MTCFADALWLQIAASCLAAYSLAVTGAWVLTCRQLARLHGHAGALRSLARTRQRRALDTRDRLSVVTWFAGQLQEDVAFEQARANLLAHAHKRLRADHAADKAAGLRREEMYLRLADQLRFVLRTLFGRDVYTVLRHDGQPRARAWLVRADDQGCG